jgi:hypothetical protein
MPHAVLITTHKYFFKKLNPKWGISFKLGKIIRCISKIRGRRQKNTLGESIYGERFEWGRQRERSSEGRCYGGKRLGVGRNKNEI